MSVSLPDGIDAATARYVRHGDDLELVLDDGRHVVLPGFFSNGSGHDLLMANGGVISAHAATVLAGPLAPGQIAQDGDIHDGLIQVGVVDKLTGTAAVRHSNGSTETLAPGMIVYQDDVLETRGDSSVGLIFADRSTFSLGSSGRMVLDEILYDPGSKGGHAALEVMQGSFSLVSGQIAKSAPSAMTVKTPVMTIGVRGTTVAGNVGSGGETSLALLTDVGGNVGQVTVQNSAGLQVISQPNTLVTLTSSFQPPPPPISIPPSYVSQNFGDATRSLPVPPAAGSNMEWSTRPGTQQQAPVQQLQNRDGANKVIDPTSPTGTKDAPSSQDSTTKTETKLAEAKPAENKESEAKPAEAKPTETAAAAPAVSPDPSATTAPAASAAAPSESTAPAATSGTAAQDVNFLSTPLNNTTPTSPVTAGTGNSTYLNTVSSNSFVSATTGTDSTQSVAGAATSAVGTGTKISETTTTTTTSTNNSNDDAAIAAAAAAKAAAASTANSSATTAATTTGTATSNTNTNANTTPSSSGKVIDGPISGATVFRDMDGDYVLDADEVSTTTAADGSFTLSGSGGTIVSVGGTDTTTGLAITATLLASGTASIVSPLTTLVQALGGDQTAVRAMLGLSADADINSLDPTSNSAAGSASMQILASVQTMKASAAAIGVSTLSYGALFQAVANAVSSSNGTLDLGSVSQMTSILSDASGLSASDPALQSLASIAATSATIARDVAGGSVTSSSLVGFMGTNFSNTISNGVQLTPSEGGNLHIYGMTAAEDAAFNITPSWITTYAANLNSVVISQIPSGASVNIGGTVLTPVNHVVTLSGSDISAIVAGQFITITPAANSGDDFALKIIATGNNGVNAVTATTLVNVDMVPVSDAPSLTAGNSAVGSEDTAINLGAIGVATADSSESVWLQISDIPADAVLKLGNTVISHDGSGLLPAGYAYLTPAQTASIDPSTNPLTITAAANSDADFTLTLTAMSMDGTSPPAYVSQSMAITVDAVSDQPTLTVGSVSGSEDSSIDIGSAITLNWGDADGSESHSLVVGNIPSGMVVKLGNTVLTPVGDAVTLTETQVGSISGSNLLTLTPMADYSGSFSLSIIAQSQDGTASPNGSSGLLTVDVAATNDAPSVTVAQSALSLTNGSLSLLAPKFSGSSDFSIVMDVNPTGEGFLFHQDAWFGTLGIIISVDATGHLTFSMDKQSTGWDWWTTTGNVTMNQWTQLAFVKSGDTRYIYVDGTLFDSKVIGATQLGAGQSASYSEFGSNDTGSGNGYDGMLQSLKLYTGGLTAAQAAILANGGSVSNNLAADWLFDTAGAPAVLDLSGNNRTLSISSGSTGTVTWGTVSVSDLAAVEDMAIPVHVFSVADSDAAAGDSVQVTISADHGSLTLNSTMSLTLVSGAFVNSASMTFTGTKLAINSALANLSYTGAANYSGSDQIILTLDDLGHTGGGNQTATQSIAVTIVGANDAPTTSAVTLSDGIEDTVMVISKSALLANAADVDGDTLSVSGVTVNHETVTDNGNGTLSFTPSANYSGSVAFGYTISDTNGGTVAGTATLGLAPVSDGAVAGSAGSWAPQSAEDADSGIQSAFQLVDADGSESLSSLQLVLSDAEFAKGSWTHGDGSSLAWSHSGLVWTATLDVGADVTAISASAWSLGNVKFTPASDSDVDVAYSLKVGITDGAATEVINSLSGTITVNPVSDQPVLTTGNVTGNEDTRIDLSNAITVNWGDAVDGSELHWVTIGGIPTGASLRLGESALSISSGIATLTAAQMAAINASNKLTVQAPTNSDDDFTLSVVAHAKDGSAAEATSSQTVAVTVNGVADAAAITAALTITSATGMTFYNKDELATSSPGTQTGSAGHDVMLGSSGVDSLFGGAGSDTLYAGPGGDSLDGGTDSNLLYGGSGDDLLTVSGSTADDSNTIFGGDGNDSIAIAFGTNELHGGLGDDVIGGGAGDDVIYGDNTFNIGILTVSSNPLDNDGSETIPYQGLVGVQQDVVVSDMGSPLTATLDAATGTNSYDVTGRNSLTLLISDSVSVLSFDVKATSQEAGGNTMTTSSHQFLEMSGGGNDLLSGGGGDDIIVGGSGNDTISGGDGSDMLYGGSGNDIFNGNDGIDSITTGSGADTILIAGGASLFGRMAVIADFSTGNDHMDLSNGLLALGASGALSTAANAKQFAVSTTAMGGSAVNYAGDGSANAGIILIGAASGSAGVEVWYSSDIHAANSGNSYQIATIQGENTSQVAVTDFHLVS